MRALAFLLLMAGSIRAQEYSFRTFGNAEGLNNLAVRQIYQDRAGFIWVSTENGIFRYDGDRFEAFGPAQGIPTSSGRRVWRSSGWLSSGGWRVRALPSAGQPFRKASSRFQDRQLGARHPVGWERAHVSRHGLGPDGTRFGSRGRMDLRCGGFPNRGNFRAWSRWRFSGWRHPLVRMRTGTVPHGPGWDSRLRARQRTSGSLLAGDPERPRR